jgi:hypothetical protein
MVDVALESFDNGFGDVARAVQVAIEAPQNEPSKVFVSLVDCSG